MLQMFLHTILCTWCGNRLLTNEDEPFVLRFDVSAESPATEDQTARIVLNNSTIDVKHETYATSIERRYIQTDPWFSRYVSGCQ